ncbi:MAG: META domain-containing protein [Methanoculleus marisnigri]|nr:META domain-containing protein [Methanoculleus marisnigri]
MAPNRRRNRNFILATASLIVIVVACIVTAGCTGGTSTPGTAVGLAGTSWTLDSFLDENGTLVGVLPGTEVTAAFGPDGKVTGSAGCNGYGGDYQIDGTSLSISSIAQTLKLCLEPEGIMDQESRFIDLLGSAAGCRIENDRLIITDAEGTDVLVFVKGDESTGLAGNTWWTLTSLAGENGTQTPVLDGTGVTVTFSAEESLGGSAGCNHYSADYTVDGAALTIEPAIRTEMYCSEPEGIMDQEDRYLALLTEVASYRMEDNLLILADSEGGDLLVFEKAAQTPDLPLVGTDWVLESYSANGDAVSSVIAGTTITANFDDGNVTGNAGCNHYGGQYSLDGADLTVSSLYSTLMYCETPGVMEQEAAFMGLLANVSSYRTEGDRLILTDAEGTDLLFFVQAPEVTPAPLAGTEWTLESFSSPGGETVSSVIVGTTITAVFDPDGNVTGSAGCNSYGAGYQLDGTNLTIEPPISTKMHCGEPEGLMNQETRYLNLLTSVAGYHIDGDRLDLLDDAGKTLLSYSAGRP